MSNNIELTEIDKIITSQLKLIDDKLSKIEFEEICEFKLNDIKKDFYLFNKLDYKGLYLFEIKRDTNQNPIDWLDSFTQKFRGREKEFLHKFTPNVVKKRKKEHTKSTNEWIPIYLGKSKNIKNRVREHIFLELAKYTFALKLKERKIDGISIFGDELFRLKTIKVDVVNYDVIVTHLEKQLRKKLNPIVGKQ